MSVWSSIPIGTVPQRARRVPAPGVPGPARPVPPPAPTPSPPRPAPTPRSEPTAAAVPSPSTPAALDAPTTAVAPPAPPTVRDVPTSAVEDGPTNRLNAHLLASRAARPTPPPTQVGLPAAPWPTRIGPPAPPPLRPPAAPRKATSAGPGPLPFLALAALLALAAAVLVPWPGSGPWVASSPVGLALLGGHALLVAPVTVDLLAGRDRSPAMLVGLPLMAAATAGTILVTGGDLGAVLAAQGLDADLTMAASAIAVALVLCLLVGIVGIVRRPQAAGAVGAPAVVMGICAAVSAAAVAALVIALGGPDPQAATVAVAVAGGTTPTAIVSASGGGPACPAEAANTLPEAATGAPVVAHDSRVHVAICQGASGALYYYGADDRTNLTITLPATRSEDSWVATNNGVTYFVTQDNLMITKPGTTLTDEALTSGWPG